MPRQSGLDPAYENSAEMEDKSRASNISMTSRSSMQEDIHGVAAKRGMVLPFQPLAISFDDVHYYVDMPAVSLPLPAIA
jgi:hypothetical protein